MKGKNTSCNSIFQKEVQYSTGVLYRINMIINTPFPFYLHSIFCIISCISTSMQSVFNTQEAK